MRVSEGKKFKRKVSLQPYLKKNLDKVAVMKKGKILNERKRKFAVCNDENGRASDDDASKTTLKRPKRQQQVTVNLFYQVNFFRYFHVLFYQSKIS
jgi:hypothetical protein